MCRLLLLLCVPYLNSSLLRQLQRHLCLTSIGLTVCELLSSMWIVAWLPFWLLAVLNACSYLQRLGSYAIRGDCSLGRAVAVNESLLSHFERPLRTNLQMGITVRDAMALEASCRAQMEALSYSMWVLSGLLGFVPLQDFTPADPELFNQLVTALSKSLAHQAQVTASHTAFLCHRHREFYLSHLLAYFSNVTKHSMLSYPAVYAISLFREEDVSRLLEATRSSSSLKSQQAMVDVASRRHSSS